MVEHHVANVRVVSSSLIARYLIVFGDSTCTAISEEMTNDEVRVIVHRKPACRIELNVKTTPALVDQARKAATKAVSKDVTLPGFRKGRAPEEMILKKFPNDIERQLHKSLADLAFVAAQKLAKVPLLNNNSKITFDLKKQSEEGAELVFSFETEPKVPSVNPKEFVAKSRSNGPK